MSDEANPSAERKHHAALADEVVRLRGVIDYIRAANTTANDLLGAQAEANDKLVASLNAEIERLRKFHVEDMRVTNASADFHIKECARLRALVTSAGQ